MNEFYEKNVYKSLDSDMIDNRKCRMSKHTKMTAWIKIKGIRIGLEQA